MKDKPEGEVESEDHTHPVRVDQNLVYKKWKKSIQDDASDRGQKAGMPVTQADLKQYIRKSNISLARSQLYVY